VFQFFAGATSFFILVGCNSLLESFVPLVLKKKRFIDFHAKVA
jgi:hypothetical protein